MVGKYMWWEKNIRGREFLVLFFLRYNEKKSEKGYKERK